MIINGQYRIETDAYNFILLEHFEREKRETGEKYETWSNVGYWSSVAGALRGMVDREILGTGLKDFQTVSKRITELHDLITSLSPQASLPLYAPIDNQIQGNIHTDNVMDIAMPVKRGRGRAKK